MIRELWARREEAAGGGGSGSWTFSVIVLAA